jgi:hypothetical protein
VEEDDTSPGVEEIDHAIDVCAAFESKFPKLSLQMTDEGLASKDIPLF